MIDLFSGADEPNPPWRAGIALVHLAAQLGTTPAVLRGLGVDLSGYPDDEQHIDGHSEQEVRDAWAAQRDAPDLLVRILIAHGDRAYRDDLIRQAVIGGSLSAYRVAKTLGVAESTVSRIAARARDEEPADDDA